MAYQVDLTRIDYMRDYVEHLKYARERLLETYSQVYQHSRYVASEVWQDTVSQRFMDVLDSKQKELREITEAIDRYQQTMTSQIEMLDEMLRQQQQID